MQYSLNYRTSMGFFTHLVIMQVIKWAAQQAPCIKTAMAQE